MGWKASLPLSG
uniref:Uncharacterized protein n=1 Tax=Arundo donax TaxID=35708 RepID=A0A0A9AYS4_ARUDO